MKKWINILVFMHFLLLAGCGPHVYYEKSVTIDSAWTYQNTQVFEFDIQDTLPAYDLFLNVSHDVEFPYQNIYTKVKTVFPDSNEVEHVISLNLTDASNQWVGDCNSSTCTANLVLSENIYFKSTGNYKIILQQHGRIDSLKGVSSLHFILSEHPQKS